MDATFQTSNARLTPTINETDGTATLADPKPAPLAELSWALEGTVIQDFTATAGTSFVHWCMDNALTNMAFEFAPYTAAVGLLYTGTVQVRPTEIGGDAGTQVTADFSMPIVGAITRTDATTGARETVKAGK
jgi:hypothetical protein